MNYDKYIGKGWSYSYKKKGRYGGPETEIYYIIDVKIVDVKERVEDDNGKTVFIQVPHKKGGGSKTVVKTEMVKRPAILAIKVKYAISSSRYNITNPTAQYTVNDSFFDKLKRDKIGDKLIYSCLEYLFEMGFDKWKKRYNGYQNSIK